MNTRYLALGSILLLGACFAAPLLASADTTCTDPLTGQQGLLISGICSTTANQCQGKPSGTTCTTSGGAGGLCDGSGACKVTGGSPTLPTSVPLVNPLGSGATLQSFLTSILAIVIRIGSIVVIVMLVYVGFMFVTARGEPGEISTAKKALLWTIVGALILLGAQAIQLGISATVQALSTGN